MFSLPCFQTRVGAHSEGNSLSPECSIYVVPDCVLLLVVNWGIDGQVLRRWLLFPSAASVPGI